MDKVDIIVIGAGVVGLAVAAELSKRFPENSVVIAERHGKFGQETSSRNSEVIHAGIYYPSGSLKAKLCVEGNRLMYDFCRRWEIPFRRLGKLVVARSEEEIPALESILVQGKANGVLDLELLDHAQVARLEPHVKAVAAVLSPSTGIIDSHKLMQRLEWQALRGDVLLAYHHEVIGLEPGQGEYHLSYRDPRGKVDTVAGRWVVNCAGLAADQVAALAGIDPDQAGYRIYPCKGEYFSIANAKSKLVSRLVYPPPLKELKGLGIHATKTLDGRLRLGPNAFYVEGLDYNVQPEHAGDFYSAARTYLPFLEAADLQPDMAGIRPKLQPEGAPFHDFVVRHEVDRGLEGLINLVGIESPGLTSAPALASMVGDMIKKADGTS